MKRWKKYAGFLLALVLCLSLTACGGGNDDVGGDGSGETIGDTEEELEQLPDISGYTGGWKVEDGTDDFYSSILITVQSISGFDPYMEKGAATADPYMIEMLDHFMNTMYSDYLIKSIGSDFKDNGDYYSITGYMWLDGSIFTEGDLSQPVRGCMEVRYYGPTGYALVASTTALESRIQNYFDICNNLLTTLSYTAGWSTAPKARPEQPAYSGDSGDYGTPYYWYDEDGDIWYWNGYEKNLSPSARTVTSTTIRANIWSRMTRAGIMRTSITTTMTHGPTPATMTTAGATTPVDCRRIYIDATGFRWAGSGTLG